MYSIAISLAAALAAGFAPWLAGAMGPGWCVAAGVAAFAVSQIVIGRVFQKRVKAEMEGVQGILLEGQKKSQAKMARWQLRPPGSIREAQLEIERDMRTVALKAIERSESLHRFDRWVPMMSRQIASLQYGLYWMMKNFAKVDELAPKVIFIDPAMCAMRLARMHMLGKPSDEIAKTYAKSVRRLRYNQNVMPAAAYSWILLKRGDADGAFKALNAALEKSDNPILKANRDHLANNRLTHFSNAGLGEQWYSLHLEEPKVRTQRQRMQWR